jgi:hypothetical protein
MGVVSASINIKLRGEPKRELPPQWHKYYITLLNAEPHTYKILLMFDGA